MPSLSQLLMRVEKTLGDIQQTVNRIEQMAQTLCNQNFSETIQGQTQATAESPSRLRRRSTTSSLTTLVRQDTGFSDVAPNRRQTQLYTVVTDGELSPRINMNPRDSEWVYLDRMFEAALARTVGLEHTKLNDVLDLIVRWLEEVSYHKAISCYSLAIITCGSIIC